MARVVPVADPKDEDDGWVNLLPSADTIKFKKIPNWSFVESSTCSVEFDNSRGDGKANVYVPAVGEDLKLYIYSIDVADENAEVELVMPVVLSNGEENLSCFGVEMTPEGIIWMCIFNRNKIVGVDLKERKVVHEFNNVPCPNDLTIGPDGLLFIAGGKKISNPFTADKDDKLLAVLPTQGAVYRINISTSAMTLVSSPPGLGALAGIEYIDQHLYITQLHDLRKIAIRFMDGKSTSQEPIQIWTGNETTHDRGGTYYFMDNLAGIDNHGRYLLAALYREASPNMVAAMENQALITTSWWAGKLATCISNAVNDVEGNKLNNGELLLKFSLGDVFDDLRFVIWDHSVVKSHHFKLEGLTKLAKTQGVDFDGHTTDANAHAGKLIFINFKSNHIMIMDQKQVIDSVGMKI